MTLQFSLSLDPGVNSPTENNHLSRTIYWRADLLGTQFRTSFRNVSTSTSLEWPLKIRRASDDLNAERDHFRIGVYLTDSRGIVFRTWNYKTVKNGK